MPQPLAIVCPDATVTLSPHSLDDKPDLAKLVCWAIATAAEIEHELSLLLVRVLGADEAPAIAMFDVLRGDYIRAKALGAAANARLNEEQSRVFEAVTSIAAAAQRDRHKLAHWIWGSCPELPNSLLVANPKFLRWQDIERRKTRKPVTLSEVLAGGAPIPDDLMSRLFDFDKSEILIYDRADLLRVSRDLGEAKMALFLFQFYLRPLIRNRLAEDAVGIAEPLDQVVKDLETSEGVLRQLSELRLFREALGLDKG